MLLIFSFLHFINDKPLFYHKLFKKHFFIAK